MTIKVLGTSSLSAYTTSIHHTRTDVSPAVTDRAANPTEITQHAPRATAVMQPREPEIARYTTASNGQLAAGNISYIYSCRFLKSQFACLREPETQKPRHTAASNGQLAAGNTYVYVCVCIFTLLKSQLFIHAIKELDRCTTRWRRCIGCLKLQVSFRK